MDTMGFRNCGAAATKAEPADRKLEGFVSTVKEKAHSHSLTKVHNMLKNDFELCSHVCYLLETGKLQHKTNAGQLPASCNKWRLLRKDKRDELVMKLWPHLFATGEAMSLATKKDKKISEHLIMRGLDVDWSSALYSKDINELRRAASERRDEVGVGSKSSRMTGASAGRSTDSGPWRKAPAPRHTMRSPTSAAARSST